MKRGDKYNFKGQPERLMYLRKVGNWNQFALVNEPDTVWAEVTDEDLENLLEKTEIEMISSTSLAEHLRIGRLVLGLSLRELEEKTGISNAYLSQLETNKVDNPSFYKVMRLCRLYNINPLDIDEVNKRIGEVNDTKL